MFTIKCPYEDDCGKTFEQEQNPIIFSNTVFKDTVLNGKPLVMPEWEIHCPHCKRSIFIDLTLNIKKLKDN